MAVPPVTDQIWKDILLGDKKFKFEFLGLKILLGRLMNQIRKNPSQENIDECAAELHNLFAKNTRLPRVKRDLQKILGN